MVVLHDKHHVMRLFTRRHQPLLLLALIITGVCATAGVALSMPRYMTEPGAGGGFSLQPGYPKLGLYANASGNGAPFLNGDGSFNTVVLDQFAKYQQVIVPASPLGDVHPEIITALRQRNTKLELSAYVMAATAWCNPSMETIAYPRHFWELVESYDDDKEPYSDCDGSGNGFLWLQNGQRADAQINNVNLAHRVPDGAGGYRFDIVEAIAELWRQDVYQTKKWDGMYIDTDCYDITWMETATEKFDYVRAGYGTVNNATSQAAFHQGWREAHTALAAKLRSLVGNFPVVGNCGQAQPPIYPYYNGWMRENFPNQNGGTWQSNMFRTVGGYLTEQSTLRQPYKGWFASWPSAGSQYSADNRRRARYGLGSAAMGDGFASFNDSALTLSTQYYLWWYDEYAVDRTNGHTSTLQKDTGYLGQPKTSYYQMAWVDPAQNLLNAVNNHGFETDLAGWKLNKYSEDVNDPNDSTMTHDASTAAVGNASIKVHVERASPYGYFTNIASLTTASVSANVQYSATFWAKAASNRLVTVVLPNSEVPVSLTTEWQHYQIPLRPTTSGIVSFRIDLGYTTGDIWFDDIYVQYGLRNVYRRDFEHGIILVNSDVLSKNVILEKPYKRILGTVAPEINTGAISSTMTVGAADALFLLN